MTKRSRYGFGNEAADKIWHDHLGNNAFVTHRDQCETCLTAFRVSELGKPKAWCPDGARIFDEMFDEVYTRIKEAELNHN